MVPPEPTGSIGEPSRTTETWLEAVRDAERRGELLSAFDLAARGLEEYPGDVELRYRAVLALARTGSTGQAARRFVELDLSAVDTEDVAALEARIQKDEALAATGDERRRLAAHAATTYRIIRDRTRGYFPAINAATLTLVAGDTSTAQTLAREALELVSSSGETSYFAAATDAEARLLLGDEDGVRAALDRAACLHEGDFGALSTTRRQLRMICGVTGTDPDILSALAGPAVVHYCGHRMAGPAEQGRLRHGQEGDVTSRVAQAVERRPAGYAYGSLASGGDILWAEALLARGCELHVVLPFSLEEFIVTSVAPAGAGWVVRFNRCLEAATSINYATVGAYLDDDVLYAYCAEFAMGLALVRARHLDSDVYQLAVWDGEPPTGVAGTAADVARWATTGHDAIVVAPGAVESEPTGGGDDPAPRLSTDNGPGRVVRAMLIGDISGFSKLTDEQLPSFARTVLGAFAAVLSRHDTDVEYRNTWGDALYVVLSGAPAAARCALDLQEVMGALDLEGVGLPAHLAFRLSGHIGPVFPIRDPVLDTLAFMGSHVSRTARIEPVTPPGAVYVTEAFAAALELSGCSDVGCDYVGHMPAAKDYGRLRMYRVGRRSPATAQRR
ncbi:MAG TPA: adenylate/guanylate cyclase domain-containing protein [Acidimicrobiales bacterium]